MLERQFYSLLGPVLCDAFINDLGTCEVPHQLQLPLPHLPQQDPGSAPLGVQTPVPKAFSDKMLSLGCNGILQALLSCLEKGQPWGWLGDVQVQGFSLPFCFLNSSLTRRRSSTWVEKVGSQLQPGALVQRWS